VTNELLGSNLCVVLAISGHGVIICGRCRQYQLSLLRVRLLTFLLSLLRVRLLNFLLIYHLTNIGLLFYWYVPIL